MNDDRINPFASPNQTSSLLLDTNQYDDSEKIHFSGNLIPEDVSPIFEHSKRTVVYTGCFLAFVVALAVLTNNFKIYVVVTGLSFLFAWVLWKRKQVSSAKSIGKQMPALFGTLRGFISHHRVCFQYQFCTYEYLLSSLTYFRADEERIAVYFSAHRQTPSVLPKRFFANESEFIRAINMMQARFEQVAEVQLGIVDERIVGAEPNYPIAPIPNNGVPYRGTVTMRDAIESKSFREIRTRSIRNTIFSLLAGTGTVYFIGWLLSSHSLAAVAAIIFFAILGLGLKRRMRGIWKLDQDVINSRGWISDSGVECGVSFARTFYNWNSFFGLEISDVAIIMQLTGLPGLHLVFAKSQFEDSTAWETAKELAKRNCPKEAVAIE